MNKKESKKKVSESQFRMHTQTSDNTLKKKKNKKNTSLRLDKQTLKALKIRAIEQETSIQNLIESLILAYLK